MICMTDFDLTELAETGRRRRANREEAAQIRATIEQQIREAHDAGVIQARIAEAALMTREAVAQIINKPRKGRWTRTATKRAPTKRTKRT